MIPEQLLLLQNGQQVGPFPADDVRAMIESGAVSKDDFAWGEGMADWATLGTLMPAAGSMAVPIESTPAETVAPAGRGKGFGSFIGDAFSYPFRGDGLIILICGTIFFTLISAFRSLPLAGIAGVILGIAAWGYLMLMLQNVIHGTALGEDRVPSWPEFDGLGELVGKWFQWMITLALCFAPAVICLIRAETKDDESMLIWAAMLGFVGAAYFPMAILGVAMFDSLAAVNPMLVARSIIRVPGHYVLTLLVFGGLILVKMFTGQLSDLKGGLGIAGSVVDQFDSLWSALFLARVLGGLYYVNRRKLGWFDR
jgi:hypothetical protein